MLAASKKYRPTAKDPMNVITSVPPRVASLTSPKSSRFSADSNGSEAADKPSIMGRSIRKLWRKSGNTAQASVRLSNAVVKQNGTSASKDLPSPPPLPNNGSRPESSTDPFHFDQQQARYPGAPRASPLVPSQVQVPTKVGNSKTRSILKGGRASQSQQPYVYDEKEKPSGLFQRRQSNRGSTPPDQVKGLAIQRPAQPEIFVPNQRPSELGGIPEKQRNLYSPPQNQNGGKLSPSSFPRTANSKSSFDLEEPYRPSYESGESPLTPRLSQFEMVSPPVKTYELDEEDRRGGRLR